MHVIPHAASACIHASFCCKVALKVHNTRLAATFHPGTKCGPSAAVIMQGMGKTFGHQQMCPHRHSSSSARSDPSCPQDTGVFHQKVQSKSMQEAMATDPSVMVDMMKRNLSGMVPQVRPETDNRPLFRLRSQFF